MEMFRRRRLAFLLLFTSLFLQHTVYGMELQLAAAIGEAYMPQPEPRSLRAIDKSAFDNKPPAAELPSLGASNTTEASGGWSKVWIGAALVAAIAIIGSKGSDNDGAVPPTASGTNGSSSGGTTSSSSGGGLLAPLTSGGGGGSSKRSRRDDD